MKKNTKTFQGMLYWLDKFLFDNICICRFSRGTVLNMLKQSRINILRGKNIYIYIFFNLVFFFCMIRYVFPEIYPGFQIMGSSGPLLEKFGGPLLSFRGPANL